MKTILFAYARTGGGHIAPAQAISEYLKQAYADSFKVVMCDFFKEIGEEQLDHKLISSWNSMLKYPLFNKCGHAILNKLQCAARIWLKLKFNHTVPSAAAYLSRVKPDFVVSTHSLAAYVLEQVKQLPDAPPCKMIYIGTDPLSSHVFCEQLRNEDLYIVSSDYSRSRLLRQGIPEEKIRIFPFPVHRKFNPGLVVSNDIAKMTGLDPDKKSVLISFGGQGVGSVEKFVRVLLRSGMKLNIVIVCGTNTTLFNRLTQLYEEQNTGELNILLLGFVKNMNELTALSNCCFIKPGGSTTFEMLTMRKPVIFYQAAVHIEDANIRFAENAGVGRYAGRNVKRFVQAVRWYTAPEGIAAVKDAYDKLKLENGTKQIGDFLHRNFGEL